MYEFVRGMLVAAGVGAAVVAVSACGSSQTAAPQPVAGATTTQLPTTTTSTTVVPTPAATTGGGATDDVPAGAAATQPGTITGSHAGHLVYNCSTTSRLLIAGDHNAVTLTGTCEQLSISGDANTVRVADVSAIDLTGDGNHVTWGSGQPQVRNAGRANVVAHGSTPGGGAATTAPVVPGTVTAAGVFACSNRTVTISGSDKAITLTGTCATVSVTGHDDTVRVAAVAAITVTGSHDKITWQSGPSGDAPTVRDTGAGNAISHG